MFETLCLSFAFVFGLAVRQVGLPPLVGFLLAGFAIHAAGPPLGLPDYASPVLDHVAHFGVLLLLFGVGLKLRLGQLAQPQVLTGALVQSAVTTAVLSLGLTLFLALDGRTALLLGVVLSFSSTVFSAKVLEARRDIRAFYGRTAIGILIVQDIIALAVLAIFSGQTPSPWAIPLLAALPLLRPVLHWLLDISGHDELLVLVGMLLSLVLGGAVFDAVGLGSEIGALAMGILLSTHPRAKELSDALWSLKELFLVGFFLQIGMSGLPGPGDLLIAVLLVLLLPLKGALFFALLLMSRLRARTAFLAAVNLTSYSEFSLIVAAGVLPDWLVPLALTVSLSFLFAAQLDRLSQRLFQRIEPWLGRFEPRRVHRDELPTDLGTASVLILGMGRTGTAAYDRLDGGPARIVGIDADTYRVAGHVAAGRNVLFADVEDAGFWRGLRMAAVECVILAMDSVEAKESAARALRQKGFSGPIVSHALYEDHVQRLRSAGATHIYQTMTQAGIGLADQASRAVEAGRKDVSVVQSRSG
ncbi:cation:proton antiporter domain-containing protein [Rhodobacter calidifons]|uniref:Cation:proton antiporter n=1 Tax=Rhodobacter calidifons TaxID=2715277 RepID=A0ABX0G8X5_9RHOB|nr:cation:proton antiporter [Rhodobacter calidifons]NHB77571.1 cation:proton antiporter [Rhodobacter calidifons]